MSDFDPKKYIAEYKRENLKRIPLEMQLSDFEKLKQSAADAGQPINTYIKQAIRERQEREAVSSQSESE